jgi:hypothetical protein
VRIWRLLRPPTRAEAIAEGLLIDVSETALDVGYRYPTAVTFTVWERLLGVPGAAPEAEVPHLRPFLLLLVVEYALALAETEERREVVVSLRWYPGATFKLVCGPDDNGATCITIMQPDERFPPSWFMWVTGRGIGSTCRRAGGPGEPNCSANAFSEVTRTQ